MIARLLRSADFERVLRTRSRARSEHFAMHHLPDAPSVSRKAHREPAPGQLSTDKSQSLTTPVDDFSLVGSAEPPHGHWLGAVVPKRHARRSVTRTLMKRQIREVVEAHRATLPGGLWVVRLRAPFDGVRFVSAASDQLRQAARSELEQLMRQASPQAAIG